MVRAPPKLFATARLPSRPGGPRHSDTAGRLTITAEDTRVTVHRFLCPLHSEHIWAD